MARVEKIRTFEQITVDYLQGKFRFPGEIDNQAAIVRYKAAVLSFINENYPNYGNQVMQGLARFRR